MSGYIGDCIWKRSNIGMQKYNKEKYFYQNDMHDCWHQTPNNTIAK